jgi:hypothetical protein
LKRGLDSAAEADAEDRSALDLGFSLEVLVFMVNLLWFYSLLVFADIVSKVPTNP